MEKILIAIFLIGCASTKMTPSKCNKECNGLGFFDVINDVCACEAPIVKAPVKKTTPKKKKKKWKWKKNDEPKPERKHKYYERGGY